MEKRLSRKGIMLCTLLLLGATAFGANGLPFYDKLEFGLKMTKVVGGAVATFSFIAAIYMHKQGRSDSLMTAVWFFGAGIVTANIEWLGEQFGFLQGVLF